MLTPSNRLDVKAAPALFERARHIRYLLGDKGHVTDWLCHLARDAYAIPVIPGRRNRKRAIRNVKQRYAGRSLIVSAFCHHKDFGRVATRYDKLAATSSQASPLPPSKRFGSECVYPAANGRIWVVASFRTDARDRPRRTPKWPA